MFPTQCDHLDCVPGLSNKRKQRRISRRHFVVGIALFALLSLVSGMHAVMVQGLATINQISLSEITAGNSEDSEFQVRFHSDSEIAWYSYNALDNDVGLKLTLLSTNLSEGVEFDAAYGPIDSYKAEQQNGKVVVELVYDFPGYQVSVYQDAASFDIILSISGYATGLVAINRASGSDLETGSVNAIVSQLSSKGSPSLDVVAPDSALIDAALIDVATPDSASVDEANLGAMEEIEQPVEFENVEFQNVEFQNVEFEPVYATETSDSLGISAVDSIVVSTPDTTHSKKPNSVDQYLPKKLTTAGPALLPKASDVAAIESAVEPGTEKEPSGSVLSDIDRMFAASLAKNPPVQKPQDSNDSISGPGSQWELDTVVLDAGHGGWDEGAFGRAGALEKNVALNLVLELGIMLREKLGLNVVYTRKDDQFITLAERGRIANQAGAKLFLSIHANSSKFTSARGTETFFLGTHRSDSAQVVMERENEVIQLEEDESQYAAYTSASLAQQALAQSTFMRHSERLAEAVQTEFRDGAFRKDRGVKQAGFYVLFGASMPAVLIELGFLTNPFEEKFLSSSDGQTTMAKAIFRAVKEYKIEYEKTLQVASQ